jgi:hypothetical protein
MHTFLTIPADPLVATLTLSRAERDRIAIFDPRCAPLLRPLLAAADLQPWYTPTGAHWLIVAPAEPIPPRLRQHLDGIAPPDAPPGWWVRPSQGMATPRIVIGGPGPTVSWDASGAVIGGPALVLPQAEPFWLAVLGSAGGRAWLRTVNPAAHPVELPTFDAPAPLREHLGALALQRVEWARTQQQADADYARRLLADFGPPGARLSARLERWWELSTAELFAALEADLHNGVPDEFQPFYAKRHAEALEARRRLSTQIADVEATIDAQAAGLWNMALH